MNLLRSKVNTVAKGVHDSIPTARDIDEPLTVQDRKLRGVYLAASLLVGLLASVYHARGDAIVVTKAMLASTIAEIFIDQRSVRVELEIAPADMEIFQDLLPDQLYAALGKGNVPLAERSERFLKDGFVLRDQHDTPLTGSLEKTNMRRRIVRDEVSGQPLSEQPAKAELILYVVLRYDFEDKPTRLTIQPPLIPESQLCAANIGFVCYHNGLPVNDFRYLPGKVTVDLDWTDPWYSRFRHPNLRRQFDAPLSVYLYVEPYEVRQEIIVRPKDLQSWLDLGLTDEPVIPVDRQTELKDRVAKFLLSKNPVTIDGQLSKGRLDRIHFIHRTLRTTGIVEPPVALDATSATLGIIFVYPITRLPKEVSMQWELFSPKIQVIPAVASDEAGGLPSQVTPTGAVLTWRNYLTNPTTPGMATIARPSVRQEFSIPVLSAICAGLVILLAGLLTRVGTSSNPAGRRIVGAMIAVAVCGFLTLPLARMVVADPFAESPNLSDAQAHELITGLLHNVYRAFDHHDESLIYDRLSNSIAGDLLADVYLETRRSMEVKNQGGLRISVKEVAIQELTSLSQTPEPTFSYRCRWRVAGWIGHWGHIHRRANEHLALLTITPLDGRWKITAIEMLDERPIETNPSATAPQ